MIWTLPNILTFARILAAPCVALVFVVFERPLADWLAFCLFVGAALTDFFDGWLARALGQISEIGKMLDPIADKAMVIIALMVLFLRDGATAPVVTGDGTAWVARQGYLMWLVLPAVLIILRETLVSGLREYLGDVKLRTTMMAKWKTTVQMFAVGVLLGIEPMRGLLAGGVPERYSDYPDAFAHMTFIGYATTAGVMLLWLAALLTVLTGWDYFQKGLAHLKARGGA